jgi:hypothetical protein
MKNTKINMGDPSFFFLLRSKKKKVGRLRFLHHQENGIELFFQREESLFFYFEAQKRRFSRR